MSQVTWRGSSCLDSVKRIKATQHEESSENHNSYTSYNLIENSKSHAKKMTHVVKHLVLNGAAAVLVLRMPHIFHPAILFHLCAC